VTRLPSIALRAHGGMPPSACVEQAVAAERAGLSTLWFAENPFTRGVWPAMAACAVATRRLRIGIGVFNPYNRHPTLMAMEMAAFDELSAGRAVLGIGAGIGTKVRKMQLANGRPIAAVRDAMTIVRRLLRGEDVSLHRQGLLGGRGPARVSAAAHGHADPHGGHGRAGAAPLRRGGRRPDDLQHVPAAYTRRAVGSCARPRRAPGGRRPARSSSTCRARCATTATRRDGSPRTPSRPCSRHTGHRAPLAGDARGDR